MARSMPVDDAQIWRIVDEEQLLLEPPVYGRVSVRGPVAVVWWALRVYVLAMATLIAFAFFHGAH